MMIAAVHAKVPMVWRGIGEPCAIPALCVLIAGGVGAQPKVLGMNAKSLSAAVEEAFIKCRDMDASLAERLQTFADAVRRHGPDFQEAVDRLVTRLKEHDVGENAPKPGDKMPPFILPDENGKLVSLDKLLEGGPVAVTFHRG